MRRRSRVHPAGRLGRSVMEAPSISLLVPFRVSPDDAMDDRTRNWHWLQAYWQHELPDAEIIIGRYEGSPFSKTAAVNDAASRAAGDILVILDADCYLAGSVVRACAQRIAVSERRGRPLWFVPYRHFNRLPPEATLIVLQSDPARPLRFTFPYVVDDGYGHPMGAGHHYGALVTMLPNEAFWQVGGMDPRFSGWGGEDVAFMHAVDTLYGRHQTSNNDVFHLYHGGIGDSWNTRQWSGQTSYMPMHQLAMSYSLARFDLARMRNLVDLGIRAGGQGGADDDLDAPPGDDVDERHALQRMLHRHHRHHHHHHHDPYRDHVGEGYCDE